MTFAELLVQVRELLQSKGRVSYRALKLQFNLDDEYLNGLKDELIEAKRLAVDEDGKVLVWIGKGEKGKRGKGEMVKGEKTSDSELPSLRTPNRLSPSVVNSR
jgi:hypothetical protein